MKNNGLATPQILLPNKKINLKKWAVVACDQYNSNPEYWQRVERFVGNSASTLHMILPEIYLDERDLRIPDITYEMEEYVAGGVVEALPEGFILVQRKLAGGTRTGLIANIDLEKYSFKPTKTTKIRPTEDTVMERIPPRVEIRKPALLETPHILVLLNDPRKKVIEPLAVRVKKFPVLYDFDLMENGGHIKGSFIGDAEEINDLYERLDMIAEENDILFAVGDGNHSLATAKVVWEELKETLSPTERKNHPKRFALVEIVNLYDEGLIFEPIHRVIFGVDTNALIGDLVRIFNRKGMDAKVYFKRSTAARFVNRVGDQSIDFAARDKRGYIQLGKPEHEMEAVNFQSVMDEYLSAHPDVKVEYIHGEAELNRLCDLNETTGFILPALKKEGFIDALSLYGVLPKKCFSLGEANDKRYYLESRLLDEVIEVDETHEVLTTLEEKESKTILVKEEKESWLEQGNNEDIISLAFAETDEYGEEMPEPGINEFLDAEPLDLRPEDYLSRKELKMLKKQQRIEKMIGEISGSADVILNEVNEDIVVDAGEPALTRREKRLLQRQKEYELLLSEMDSAEKKRAEMPKKQKQTTEETPRVLTWREKRIAEETERIIKEPERKTVQEMVETDIDSAPLSKRELRALQRQQEYEALLAEIENDSAEAGAEPKEEITTEAPERPLSRKEMREQKRMEKYNALMAELGMEPEAEPEKPEEAKKEADEEVPLSRKEQRALARQQRTEELLAMAGIDTEEAEEADAGDETPDMAALKKSKKVPKAVLEALEGMPEEEEDLDLSVYALEKARIRLEEERIKLERYKVREETRLKLQLEREKQKAMKRMEREALMKADEEELAELLRERTGSDAVDEERGVVFQDERRRKGLAGILDEVVSEVKRGEAAGREPEKVIMRKGTSEIIGRRKLADVPDGRQKNKRRKGTLVVKRAGGPYDMITSTESTGKDNGEQ